MQQRSWEREWNPAEAESKKKLRGRAKDRTLGASSKIMHVVRQQNVRATQLAFYGQGGR